jgi:Uma2 family endonuclease
MTLEEYEQTIDEPGYRFELVQGRIDVSAEPELSHDDDAEWLADLLRDYRRKRPKIIGKISVHSRIYLPNLLAPTCLEPDIAVFRERTRSLPAARRKWKFINAILIIEILSPDTAKKDLVRNVELYLQVPSIREYWIVDSRQHLDRPKLIVYRRRGKRWQKPIEVPFGGTYETKLLPGFKLLVDPRA